ncbi:MAG TPA: methyltransferase domain-containing protein [Gaiellales bacterium]|nr:methyltransferase domain-containing protein [Gaiellales bacterium]
MHAEDATSAAADAEYRERSTLNWETAAAGWESERDRMRQISAPVTDWLVDHLELRPGLTVLELAAGTGDVGIRVAETLAGQGRVILSDRAAAMVEAAGRWVTERGASGIELRVLDAESLDLPDASVDRVVCRFAYMLVPDRDAAFAETRRVLRPGGRVAFAVWAGRERNDWATTLWDVLESRAPLPPARPGGPGMFALADRRVVEETLARAGLEPEALEEIPVSWRYAGFDDYWRTAAAMNGSLTRLLPTLPDSERADLAAAVRDAIERFRDGEGYRLPGLALGVAAGRSR